mgnify:CR=1 FL=1
MPLGGQLNYAEFAGIVIGGRQNGNSVMPAFADNKNASCYIDDLYVYLRALSTGAVTSGSGSATHAPGPAVSSAPGSNDWSASLLVSIMPPWLGQTLM